jgi:hypothetical protein
MNRPRPAPPYFPYRNHGTLEQVWRQERLAAERARGLRLAQQRRIEGRRPGRHPEDYDW